MTNTHTETLRRRLPGVLVPGVLLCLLGAPAANADDRDARHPTSALNIPVLDTSSPFEPPTEDAFVTNAGPGLDTGCTFNDEPEHPLIIDVLVDQSVGEVDANGFLVDAQSLIDAGIIPATFELVLPAFDVDVNGGPPPESDEVLFNGESLGFLNGDDGIWLLNSFRLDIRKLKFPAPGGPAAVNTVQVNIDTLSTGTWCTAIDWVAFIVPIRQQYAVTLEVMGGNPVREIADNVIYRQSFDADCNVVENQLDFAEFPFVGSREKDVILRATLDACGGGAGMPEVDVQWQLSGPVPLQTRGETAWTGTQGNISLRMLDRVADGTANLAFTIDQQMVEINRRALTTLATPKATSDCTASPCRPKRTWYERGVEWAGGSDGATDEAGVINQVRTSMFGNPLSWKYLDGNDPSDWVGLVEGSLNDGNCVAFTAVLQNLSAVLGASAGSEDRVVIRSGFVTRPNGSLDSAFTGMAGAEPSGTLDRYVFGMHSLLKKGSNWQDATFNGSYSSREAFVDWRLDGGREVRDSKNWLTTGEGALLRRTGTTLPSPYDATWGNEWRYLAPAPVPFADVFGGGALLVSNAAVAPVVAFEPIDEDGDGFAEALRAAVTVDTTVAGEFFVSASLVIGSDVIPARGRSNLMNSGLSEPISGPPGSYTVNFEFPGESIATTATDGPYSLRVDVSSETMEEDAVTVPTPAYAATDFGELKAVFLGSVDRGVDEDGDGRFDQLRTSLTLNARVDGEYFVTGTLWKDEGTIVEAQAIGPIFLDAGEHALEMDFGGVAIRQFGEDGPYTIFATVTEVASMVRHEATFDTAGYLLDEFTFTLLRPDGNFSDDGVDDNGNGLFELLRVNVGLDVAQGNFQLAAILSNGTDSAFVYSAPRDVAGGLQSITFDFSGEEINSLELDGPYTVELTLRDPATMVELERVLLEDTTRTYSFLDFEGEQVEVADIRLTGNSTDIGIDTDGDGLFDQLQVDVELELTQGGTYEWSARLEDPNGTDITFDSRSGSLSAGVDTITFIFDGNAIGTNGVDGPFEVNGLLIFSNNGANLVAADVATTRSYTADQFEGFVPPIDGDLDGDGDIDGDDFSILRDGLGSCTGDPRFVQDADYDADGCITFADYRIWYGFFRAQ
ncbi:MAG: hypothetical protein AAGA68_19565 [Pseudomonadota bacterium]